MHYTLTDSDIQAFDRDGAIALRGVVDHTNLTKIARAADQDIIDPGPFFHG
jgi:hypothetical protein